MDKKVTISSIEFNEIAASMSRSAGVCEFVEERKKLIAHIDERLNELVEALEAALPYVKGAYECAFPDEDENEEVISAAESALKKARGE
jgi:hypothetical protein